VPGVSVTTFDTGDRCVRASFIDRVAHRLRRPIDWAHVNQRVLVTASTIRPDVVFFDNSKVIQAETLRRLKRAYGAHPVFYTPDNVIAAHNSSSQLESSWKEWSVVFTTKHFNVPDFSARGAKLVHVIGNAFDPDLHRPLEPEEVGSDFERFDVAFVGTAERERRDAINHLACLGLRAVVFGEASAWGAMNSNVVIKPPVWDLEYSRAMHTAKVSLCFLRRINGDTVTTRSMEIPAMARAMAAERTEQHDKLFEDGKEYFSFSTAGELLSAVRRLVADEARRRAVGRAARERCVTAGYSTLDRAREMKAVMEEALARA
jgi:hypothetical protein